MEIPWLDSSSCCVSHIKAATTRAVTNSIVFNVQHVNLLAIHLCQASLSSTFGYHDPTMSFVVFGLFILLALGYLHKLSNRLRGSDNKPRPSLTVDELAEVSYKSIDLLNTIPRDPTRSGYAVIGGSGFLGTYVLPCIRCSNA